MTHPSSTPTDHGWFEDGADKARILVRAEATDGAWSLMEWVIAPAPDSHAPNYGAHLHGACEETFVVRSGSLDFLFGDNVLTLVAGDSICVPPGVRHGYANLSGEPVTLLAAFHPAGLEALFETYRTDRETPATGEGFIADATRLHASAFEGL